MNRLKYFLPLFLLIYIEGNAQLQKFTANGYIKDLYMFYKPENPIPGIDANHLSSNLIHNRLNFRWYATNEFTFAVEARNRFFSGQLVRNSRFRQRMVFTLHD